MFKYSCTELFFKNLVVCQFHFYVWTNCWEGYKGGVIEISNFLMTLESGNYSSNGCHNSDKCNLHKSNETLDRVDKRSEISH